MTTTPTAPGRRPSDPVHRVDLGTSSAYVLAGTRPILIDTGTPGQGARLETALRRLSFDPRALSLIVLTHAHWDHLGSADEVRRLTGAPIALHPADQHHLRAGRHPRQPAQTRSAWTRLGLHRTRTSIQRPRPAATR